MNELQEAELKILKYFDRFVRDYNIEYFLFAGTLLGCVRHKGFIPWDDDVDVGMKRSEFDRFEKEFLKSDYRKMGFSYQSRKVYPSQASSMSKIRSNEVNMKEKMPKTQKGNFGPWIDIFPYDNIPDDQDKREEQYKKINFYNNIIKKFLLIQVEPNDKGIKKILKKIIQMTNENVYEYYFFLPYLFKERDKWMRKYNHIETSHSADLSYMHYKNFEDYSSSIIKNKYLEDLVDREFEGEKFRVPVNTDEILTNLYGDYMKLPDESERKKHKIEYLIKN